MKAIATMRGKMRRAGLPCRLCVLLMTFLGVLSSHALEVYFLRHGETTWNRDKILQGSISHPDLTEKGVRMAEDTAKGMATAGISFGLSRNSAYFEAPPGMEPRIRTRASGDSLGGKERQRSGTGEPDSGSEFSRQRLRPKMRSSMRKRLMKSR